MCNLSLHNIGKFMDIHPLWEHMKESPFYILDTKGEIKQKLFIPNKDLIASQLVLTVFNNQNCIGFFTDNGNLTDDLTKASTFTANMCVKINDSNFENYHFELRNRSKLHRSI